MMQFLTIGDTLVCINRIVGIFKPQDGDNPDDYCIVLDGAKETRLWINAEQFRDISNALLDLNKS